MALGAVAHESHVVVRTRKATCLRTRRKMSGGQRTAALLGAACVVLFTLPAVLVTRGHTIAGDRQKENVQDIARISANDVRTANSLSRLLSRQTLALPLQVQKNVGTTRR